MGDSKQTEIQMPPSIRYLSQSSLQNLQLTTQDIAASIEHLFRGRDRQQVWNAPKEALNKSIISVLVTKLSAK